MFTDLRRVYGDVHNVTSFLHKNKEFTKTKNKLTKNAFCSKFDNSEFHTNAFDISYINQYWLSERMDYDHEL